MTHSIHLRRYPWGLHLIHRASDGTGYIDTPVGSLVWRKPWYSFIYPRRLWSALVAIYAVPRRIRIDPEAVKDRDLRFIQGSLLCALAVYAISAVLVTAWLVAR